MSHFSIIGMEHWVGFLYFDFFVLRGVKLALIFLGVIFILYDLFSFWSTASCVRVITIGFLLARVTSEFHWSGDLWVVYRSLFVCIVFPLYGYYFISPGGQRSFQGVEFWQPENILEHSHKWIFSKYGLYVFYDYLDVMIWCYYLWVRVFFISFVLPHFIYISVICLSLLLWAYFCCLWAYFCFIWADCVVCVSLVWGKQRWSLRLIMALL